MATIKINNVTVISESSGSATIENVSAIKLTPTATASAPSGTAGALYFDSDLDTLMEYDGTTWQSLNPNKSLASGGIETTYSGYKVHTFKSSSTFTVTGVAKVCDILIIAGGGGTSDMSGGGGAGGYQYLTSQTVAVGNHTITVGAGGTRSLVDTSTHGGKGGDSQFGSLTASKGGGGAGYEGQSGQTGGSGGGASYTGSGGAVEVAGQGYPGGGYSGATTGSISGGGGGGASQAGTTGGATHNGGDGGNGIQNNIDGNNYWWSGGGGGHCYESSTSYRGGNGGKGGGGGGNVTFGHGAAGWGDQNGIEDAENGYSNNTYESATGHGGRNTGGGGGGGTNGGTAPPARWGSKGGSGIVIVRYVN
jgi:hypothetical protein